MAEEYEDQIEEAEEAGNVSKILEIVQVCTSKSGDDDWTDVTEGSLDALFRLAKGGNNDAISVSVVETIFKALQAWKDEEAIVEVALGCLVSVLSKLEGIKDDDIPNLELALIWKLLEDFSDESTIQEQACLTVEGFALASSTWKQCLLDTCGGGDVTTTLTESRERITNERNKAYPGRAAKALGVDL